MTACDASPPLSSPLAIHHTLHAIEQALGQVIVGQPAMIRGVVTALCTGGHVLLEGLPGLGKTLLVRTLAQVLSLTFTRVQCTPDLLPRDILGTVDQPGPIVTHLLLADEINRATPRTQAAMLEAMAEGQVTLLGQTRHLPSPFLVLATQNPVELDGTYPLPEAQLDRFLLKLLVPSPTAEELITIAQRTTQGPLPHLAPLLDAAGVLALRAAVAACWVSPSLYAVGAQLVVSTHPTARSAHHLVRRYVQYGASPRGLQSLIRASQLLALFDGRTEVWADDLRAVVLPCLRHRLILNYEGASTGVTTDQILTTLMETVGVGDDS